MNEKNFKINCVCGKPPSLKSHPISIGADVEYFFVKCSDTNCKYEIQTFATRLPEFCWELWHATVLKVKSIQHEK